MTDRLGELPDRRRGMGGMEQAVWNGVAPVHRDRLGQGVDRPPAVNGHEDVLGVLTLVEHVDVEHLKVNNMDLGVIPPQLVSHLVQIAVPAPANEQEVLPVQVLRCQPVLGRQGVIDGYRAADGLPGQLQGVTLPVLQKILVKEPRDNIDVLPQIAQDLHRVLRGVLIGHHLEFDIGTVRLNGRPEVQQELAGRHRGNPDADDLVPLLGGILGPHHGVLAVLHHILGVPVNGFARLGKLQPAGAADKELEIQAGFQRGDLLDHRRRRDEQFLRRSVEAPRVRHPEKGLQLGIIHHTRRRLSAHAHRPYLETILLLFAGNSKKNARADPSACP